MGGSDDLAASPLVTLIVSYLGHSICHLLTFLKSLSMGHYSRVPPACRMRISVVALSGAPFEWRFEASYLLPSSSCGHQFGSLGSGSCQPVSFRPVSFSIVSFSPETGSCKGHYKLKAIPTSSDTGILKAPPIFHSFFCLSELF